MRLPAAAGFWIWSVAGSLCMQWCLVCVSGCCLKTLTRLGPLSQAKALTAGRHLWVLDCETVYAELGPRSGWTTSASRPPAAAQLRAARRGWIGGAHGKLALKL